MRDRWECCAFVKAMTEPNNVSVDIPDTLFQTLTDEEKARKARLPLGTSFSSPRDLLAQFSRNRRRGKPVTFGWSLEDCKGIEGERETDNGSR